MTKNVFDGVSSITNQRKIRMPAGYPSQHRLRINTATKGLTTPHPTTTSLTLKKSPRFAYVYAITKKNEIILDKEGTSAYIASDIINLLRIEDGEESHYVYIKNLSHFIHTSNNSNTKR